MEKLYRFRRCEPHTINSLKELTIEGSKYCTMGDTKEASLWVDVNKLSQITKLDKTILSNTANLIRNHILNTYYISCFTMVDQIDEINMWSTYANNDGFCLVYDDKDIAKAIKQSLLYFESKSILFERCDYGTGPVDITVFIEKFLKLVGADITNEARYIYAASNIYYSLNKDERKNIMRSFFHKIGPFPEKKEKRIVSLSENNSSNWCSNILNVPVRPKEIICSSKMREDYCNQIKHLAKIHKIPISIHQIENN